MSMYACNNICKAVNQYKSNGIYVGGVIVNARSNTLNREIIGKFVTRIGLDIIAFVPRSDVIACAEYKAKTVLEYKPDALIIEAFDTLIQDIMKLKKENKKDPTPMSEDEFDEFFKQFEIIPNEL